VLINVENRIKAILPSGAAGRVTGTTVFVGLLMGRKQTRCDNRGPIEMRRTGLSVAILAAMMLAACVPPPPEPLNALAFEKRPPLPGHPGYLETIKFIDNGVRYIAPTRGFFVSNIGDLCFKGVLVPGITPEYIPDNFWCISPFNVTRVEAIENDISYINQVRLWCQLAAPQCAYKVGYPNMLDNLWDANSITAETVPFLRQRDAIAYLIYLMGGEAEVERHLAAQ
jgi:hypothetical protein